MNLLQRPSFQLLERSLEASTLRNKVIANNIANVDTPHYKRAEVEFESILKTYEQPKLRGKLTHPAHIPIGMPAKLVQPRVVHDETPLKMNNNHNNVDMDYEMSMLAQNQLRYNMLVQQVNHEINMMRTSISGRG